MKLWLPTMLLAQLKASQPKPGDWSFGWATVGIIAAVSASIVLAIWLIMLLVRLREQRTRHSPWLLFGELCAAHGLTHAERRLARQLAKQLQLDHPAVLFVEPAWWGPERVPLLLTCDLPALEKLRKRLFVPR
jgi:hypothetical protein